MHIFLHEKLSFYNKRTSKNPILFKKLSNFIVVCYFYKSFQIKTKKKKRINKRNTFIFPKALKRRIVFSQFYSFKNNDKNIRDNQKLEGIRLDMAMKKSQKNDIHS